jgi:hypothetical protein
VLERDAILRALDRLAELLRGRDVEGEICLLGGAVMVLAFRARPSTKDVDAIFHPTQLVRELARTVATEQGLPEDWLNDGAKAFVSERHEVVSGDLPQFPGLRVLAPTAEYMLALKCMAARIATEEGAPDDVGDIRLLVRHLGLRSVDAALDIVCRYYPAERVPPRTQYLLEEVLAEVLAEVEGGEP